jgi:antitoxin PrlF
MLSNTSYRLGITEEVLMAVTVTSKGQVTVPKQVRDRLGIKPGSKVDFEVAEDGRAFLRKVGKRTVKPSRFERMRGTATGGLTTDAIMALSRGESRWPWSTRMYSSTLQQMIPNGRAGPYVSSTPLQCAAPFWSTP